MNPLVEIWGSMCDRQRVSVDERSKMWTKKLNKIIHWREEKSYIEELVLGKNRKHNGEH